MEKKKLVIFTGSGISAESGIKTFRDSDGLWENYNVDDVASIDGWRRNRKLVIDFYNERRKHLSTVSPNSAHTDLVELERDYDVTIITQNVDDLHERAGSSNILHLHGELVTMKACGNGEVFEWPQEVELTISSTAPDGSALRPNIVWFGEQVPNMSKACKIASEADIFVVIGSSLQVYPAASLLGYVDDTSPIYIIDPNVVGSITNYDNMIHIKEVATEGVKKLIEYLK